MSIASVLESLGEVVQELRGDPGSACGELVQRLEAFHSASAAVDGMAELAELAAEAATQLRDAVDGNFEGWACSAEQLEFVETLIAQAGQILGGEDSGELELPGLPAGREDPQEDLLDPEMFDLFISSCMGFLNDIEAQALEIEGNEDPQDAMSDIRRVVHTLKGESGVMSLEVLQCLCHEAESMMDRCIESSRPFPVDPLLALVDWTKQYVEALNEDARARPKPHETLLEQLRQTPDLAAAADPVDQDAPVTLDLDPEFADSVADFIVESNTHLSEAEAAMLAMDAGNQDPEQINLTFRAFHTIKGVAGFLGLTAVVDIAHHSETLMDKGRSGALEFGGYEIDLVLQSIDLVGSMLRALEGAGEAPRVIEVQEHSRRLSAALEAGPDSAELVSESVVVEAEAMPAVAPSGALPSQPSSRPVEPAKASAAGRRTKIDSTIKVNTARLDALVDMVGELVIGQTMVLQDPALMSIDNQTLQRNISQVGKITRDLQESAMSLRMVTLKSTFQKMARLVRDVSSKSGKLVNLTIVGEDTELDRNVVEEIGDPLVHMLRNAVDHGIEMPEARRAAGKSETGELVLKAYHQGGSIVIELRDDGKGLDRTRILEKATERGLIASEDHAEELSDAQVFNMIFQPGFSTAEKVTDLSGRGVGMDVVRRNIEALRGKVDIDSVPGEGSVFSMRLPLTLAIIDGMVVRVGEARYVIPTHAIEQSLRANPEDIHYLQDSGEMVTVRGSVLPIFRLKEIFAQESGFDALEEGILVVMESGEQRCCLLVDEILGQQQVVIKSLGVSTARIPGVSGGAIMGNGRVALIVDVAGLMEEATAEVG